MDSSRGTLTIAIPKGTLYKPSLDLLQKAGFNTEELAGDSRQLYFTVPADNVRYIICRPTDIPTFVEYGAADLGIAGKDTLAEQGKDVYELLDLKYGFCRFVVAAPAASVQECGGLALKNRGHARVATKFPRVAEEFFRSQGMQAEIIKLHGNIELAPLVGLADMIVDIVSTGRTLRENNLVELVDVMNSTARLIANRVNRQFKADRINRLLEQLAALVDAANKEG
ncbi:ATP phosphoribosyltransferase [Desulfofarcimen acetoxidans DSM 771]|uniref:ATP phosphoribosyltransferase n=1 Tax=Desulfofarcimen acetoxidans (strain ATCC 49208 / DSM 771 / KCTC 5769 / VKM B-1644 / 5575) TaxID=485916 RepID=C8W1L5_DESAS|nr:ATP phosphoribosyltransferase [Desulfofarcimen acetoxidans]ACV61660.1 ATP phosphoribosyltransferase [Desulfofarcimen acetoxidans DSM 771]